MCLWNPGAISVHPFGDFVDGPRTRRNLDEATAGAIFQVHGSLRFIVKAPGKTMRPLMRARGLVNGLVRAETHGSRKRQPLLSVTVLSR